MGFVNTSSGSSSTLSMARLGSMSTLRSSSFILLQKAKYITAETTTDCLK